MNTHSRAQHRRSWTNIILFLLLFLNGDHHVNPITVRTKISSLKLMALYPSADPGRHSAVIIFLILLLFFPRQSLLRRYNNIRNWYGFPLEFFDDIIRHECVRYNYIRRPVVTAFRCQRAPYMIYVYLRKWKNNNRVIVLIELGRSAAHLLIIYYSTACCARREVSSAELSTTAVKDNNNMILYIAIAAPIIRLYAGRHRSHVYTENTSL